jgi:hypothetical protein
LENNTILHDAFHEWSSQPPQDRAWAEAISGFTATAPADRQSLQFSSYIQTTTTGKPYDPYTYTTAEVELNLRFVITDSPATFTLSLGGSDTYGMGYHLRANPRNAGTVLYSGTGSSFANGNVVSGILQPGEYQFSTIGGQSSEQNHLLQLNFNLQSLAPPPQKVFFAWNQTVPQLVKNLPDRIGVDLPVIMSGSMPAYLINDGETRELVEQKVRNIFLSAGITNLEFVSSPDADTTSIYFAPPLATSIGGVDNATGGIARTDRFNEKRAGIATLFMSNRYFDGATINTDHLQHVNPNGVNEIMDYEWGAGISSSPSDIIDFQTNQPTGLTHNPLYHLERYIDGYSNRQAGSYDVSPNATSTESLRLGFGEEMTLFDLYLLAQDEGSEIATVLAHFDTVTLAQIEEMTFSVAVGTNLKLVAASSSEGSLDIVLASGDPFASTGIVFLEGGASGQLFRFSGLNYIEVTNATVDLVPEPSSTLLCSVTGALLLSCRQRRSRFPSNLTPLCINKPT